MKNKSIKNILTLIIITALLSSCGSPINRNELQNLPTIIEIMGINLNEGDLNIRISHRNNLLRQNNQLSCQLALKDYNPIKFDQIPVPDLTNYAVETLNIKLSPTELPKIGKNSKEISYVLDCYLFSENFRQERLIKKSSLFRVPGTVSEFR